MRALGCALALVLTVAFTLTFAAAGCAVTAPDPCKGVAGSCVALTVQSTTVAAVDSLRIVASGALTGDQTSSGGRANLPIVVALRLPAATTGSLDLHVDASLTAMRVGSCDTDTLVIPGQHGKATCILMGVDATTDLGAGADGGDLAGTGPDMLAAACDPKGAIGPQCVWRWQAPLPQGDAALSLVAFDDANTYLLSADGFVYHRDATAWSMLPARPALPMKSTPVSLFGGGGATQDLYVGVYNFGTATPLVFHSPDRGATWSAEALPAGASGDVGQGATTGQAAILPNRSGGNVFVRDATAGTWSTQSANDINAVWNAAAMNANGAIVVGSSGAAAAIAYTVSNGAAWTDLPDANLPAGTPLLVGACVGANGATNSYWAVGGSTIIHGAGNTPNTFTLQASLPATNALFGCVATDATHAWAYGVGATLYATTDGVNWAAVAAGPPAAAGNLVAGAHGSGSALTVATATGGQLFRSTNDGASFTAERSGPADSLDAVFGVAPGVVYAVGAGGAIDKTSDDGASWISIPSAMTGSTAQLTAVWGASTTDVYAVGSAGTLLHSSDGTTFTKYGGANLPTATTLFRDVFGSAAAGVFAVGGDGTSTSTRVAYHTADHGVTWTPVTITGFTGASGLLLTTFVLGSDVWIGGDNGNIYHSTDGTTFTKQDIGSTTLGVTYIRGVAGHLIALFGSDPGTFYSTTNNGATWTAPTVPPFTDTPTQIAFAPDESAILVFGSFPSPYVSTDKGATWPLVTTPMNPQTARAAFAFAGNDIFVVGDDSFVVGGIGIIHYGN